MSKWRATPYPCKKNLHPHCAQAETPVYASDFNDILHHCQSPRQKYAPRDRALSVLHLGQRKLLMSEIGALILLDAGTKYVAVYAGAAPGIHTPLLSELFPNVTFHLYDPAPFRIRETERIRIFNVCFTDETARTYSDEEHLVFICDIRRSVDEQMVWEDMQAQRHWHEIMRPVLTSLKFRLPWPGNGVADASNQVEYLDGDIHLPIWAPVSTTEGRLVIEEGKHASTRIYDCLAYEEEMCHFNRVVRPSIHRGHREQGLDGCYDCTAEVRLLEKYRQKWTHTEISTERISRELRRGIMQRD